MEKRYKFFNMSSTARRWVVEAGMWLVCVTVASKVAPYRKWQRWMEFWARPGRHDPRSNHAQTDSSPTQNEIARQRQIVWAVDRVSRFAPWTNNCLPRAWVAYIMLRRHDFLAELHMGVLRNENGEFQAHAWVESQGSVVMGNVPNLHQYQRLERQEK